MIEGLRRPDSGEVAAARRAGLAAQPALLPRIGVQLQASAFFERLTAREQIRTFASLYGVARRAADEWLERVGLDRQGRHPHREAVRRPAQRLSIACALVHDPEVVFLDEPTAALDPQARRNLWDLLRALNDAGRTVVLTTHYMDEAEALCDRVAIMDHGRILRARHAGRAGPRARRAGADHRSRRTCCRSSEAAALPGVDARRGRRRRARADHPRRRRRCSPGSPSSRRSTGLQVKGGTLEDVFLDLTGREYRA